MMENGRLKSVVEAIIFASDEPVKPATLVRLVEDTGGVKIDEIIEALNADYIDTGRAFKIDRVGGGFQLTTQPEFAPWIKKHYSGRSSKRLSQAALETLAMVAFKQPLSKAEINDVRGVNSDGVVKSLLEKRLIAIIGRGEGVGRPLLYGTTPEFLQYFGINNVSDLPKPREIEELFGDGKYAEEIVNVLSSLDEDENAAEENPTEESKPEAEVEQAD